MASNGRIVVEDIPECCICNEALTDPRTLPCNHTFCLDCLHNISLQRSKKPGWTFPCPICRKEFPVPATGWKSTHKNLTIKSSVETTRTSKAPSSPQEVKKETERLQCNGCQRGLRHQCRERQSSQQISQEHRSVVPEERLATQESHTSKSNSHCELSSLNKKAVNGEVNGGLNDSKGASDPEPYSDVTMALEKSQSTDDGDDLIHFQELEQKKQIFLRDVDTAEKAIATRRDELQDIVEMHASFLCDQLSIIKENGLREMVHQKQKLETRIDKEVCSTNQVRTETDLFSKSNVPWHQKWDLHGFELDHYRSEIGSRRLDGELDCQKGDLADKKCKKFIICQISTENADHHQEDHGLFEQHQVLSPGKVSFKISEIQDFLSSKNILGQIKVDYPTELHHLVRLKIPAYIVCGLTKVDSNIFVLCQSPNVIRCYEDDGQYALRKEMKIKQIRRPWDMTSRPDSHCLYVTDREKNCVWKVKIIDRRITRWLSAIGNPWTISAARSTGHILMVRNGRPSTLELYGPDAKLIHCLPLSVDVENPLHAVETSTGHFIVSHKSRVSRSWVVSELARDGQTVRRFSPKGKAQELNSPSNLTIDADDRLFVVDYYNRRVVLLERDLRWGRTLLREKDNADRTHIPLTLCYDRDKRQLIVSHDRLWGAVDVYRIL